MDKLFDDFKYEWRKILDATAGLETAIYKMMQENCSDEFDAGREDGYDQGEHDGYDNGYACGRDDGYAEGYEDGLADAKEK
jgi:flagellar biosynthesis/type III secretory pathway protein FliH